MPLPAPHYSPLPPPGHDSSSHPKSGLSIHISQKTSSKRNFLLRISAFTLLELGFIALAFVAGRNPVVLNLPFSTTLTEAKGGFTVISILWHALAAFTVRGILLHIFSAECIEQYRTSGDLVPGETDIVSRITAGYVEQIKHFISKKATVLFRISFISTLLLVFLNALGPSTTGVSSITVYRPSMTQVANMTVVGPEYQAMLEEHASMVVKLEYLEGTDYGFTANGSNILIPWPSPTPTSTDVLVAYESDVIIYNFSCSWKQPTFIPRDTHFVSVDTQEWGLVSLASSRFPDNIVLPLSLNGPISSPVALLFVGSNSTPEAELNLEDIPTTSFPKGVPTTIFTDIKTSHFASVLVCDPQMQVVPATVTLSNGSQLKAVPRSGPPIVNNILVEAASWLFPHSLAVALSSQGSSCGSFSEVVCALFLNQTSLSNIQLEGFYKPLFLEEINQNMNEVLMSSAKAYLSGYRPYMADNGRINSTYNTMDTEATVAVQVLALSTSRPFLISLLVISSVLIVLLSVLVLEGQVDELREFDLENILGALRVD